MRFIMSLGSQDLLMNGCFNKVLDSGLLSTSFSKHLLKKSTNSVDHFLGSFKGGIPLVVIKNNA